MFYIYYTSTFLLKSMKKEDMSYVFVAFINGIVVALVAAYVYNIERRMGEIYTKLDKTESTVDTGFTSGAKTTAWEGYLGCFRDKENSMLPSKTVKGISDLTLKKCQQQCHGFIFLGLQFANECFCGNNLNSDQFRQVHESECNMKCSGEKRMCGSGGRNSVYRVPF